MPLKIIRDDITHLSCDAIVNAANSTLLGGGGVDGAIHRAAGKGLYEECRMLGGCRTGEAKITGAYELPCRYVIHTVGPVYEDGFHGEEELLRSCYRNSLLLAAENSCTSVAFPLISAGAYGYPHKEAFQTAVDEITRFLDSYDNDMLVIIVVFDRSCLVIGQSLLNEIDSFIDQNYVEEYIGDAYVEKAHDAMVSAACVPPDIPEKHRREFFENLRLRKNLAAGEKSASSAPCTNEQYSPVPDEFRDEAEICADSLDDALNNLDESFSQMLLRKIDESGMTDSQCYKRANIDRKLFSKIRNDVFYRPSKYTVIAFAIALELPLDEAKNMLMKAGYALSHSNKADIIIEYFITRKNYNVFEINEVLFEYDQLLLGLC